MFSKDGTETKGAKEEDVADEEAAEEAAEKAAQKKN